MLKMEWNALRIDDRVLVHDGAGAELAHVRPGVVAMVHCHTGTNAIGIRVATGRGTSLVRWPSYLAVHRDPPDSSDACWRCEPSPEPAGPNSE